MFYRAEAAGTPVVTSSPLDLAGKSSCWVPNGDDEGVVDNTSIVQSFAR